MSIILSEPSANIPLLNQLSGGTTVIGAWSMARKLKTGVTAAFYAQTIGGGPIAPIGFVGATLLVDTSTLTTANMGLYGGAGGHTSRSWLDQTGNGNHLGRGNPNSYYCPVTTGAGALNAPITVTGGFSMPMLSLGYNGLSAANNGPFLSCDGLGAGDTGGVMAVDYGTSSAFWCFMVVRPKSGAGHIDGSLANYVHTGDSNPDSTAGSATFAGRNNSTTSGAIYADHNSQLATDTAPVGTPTLIGSVFDGTQVTMYVDRAAGTPTGCTGGLASTGNFASGDFANAGAFGNVPFAGDVVEIITGTTMADLTLIQNNMRAFYGTP